jgi:predicted RNA-binding protein with PIN domain
MLRIIDGYNLMHAMGATSGHETGLAFQKKRRRFLNALAHDLGTAQARDTLVVFDANSPPADFELETTYKGLSLVFALGDESADARIEQLIADHSAPRSLTVVSSDRRIRRAATRRKAEALTADEFLDWLERHARRKRNADAEDRPSPREEERDLLDPLHEAKYWLEKFGDIENDPETRELRERDAHLLTDDEIARIQRQVDGEE